MLFVLAFCQSMILRPRVVRPTGEGDPGTAPEVEQGLAEGGGAADVEPAPTVTFSPEK